MSPHTGLVDVQLNYTMRVISGTLRSTPLPWLPVLANTEPPVLHRKAATDEVMEKIIAQDNWPIHSDITSQEAFVAGSDTCGHQSQWKENWKSAQVVNFSLVDDPTIQHQVLIFHNKN